MFESYLLRTRESFPPSTTSLLPKLPKGGELKSGKYSEWLTGAAEYPQPRDVGKSALFQEGRKYMLLVYVVQRLSCCPVGIVLEG